MLDRRLLEKKAFIFDVDGTLIDSVGIWNEMDKIIIHDLGGVDVSLESINHERDVVVGQSKSSDPYYEYTEFLKEKYNIASSVEEMINYRKSLANDFLRNRVTLTPYAYKLINMLDDLNITLALGTTTRKHNIRTYALENPHTKPLDFYRMFKYMVTMEDVKNFKPDPEVYLKALELLGTDANEAIVVEDTITGVEAARRAGIDVIAVREKGSADREVEIRELATYYVSSLGDIYDFYKENGHFLRKIPKND